MTIRPLVILPDPVLRLGSEPVGPITAAATGLPTVDLGAPQLAMHSARELCATSDPGMLQVLLVELLGT